MPQPYEMKDSGVTWIGEIPKGWEVVKCKTLMKNLSIKGHGDAQVLSLYRDYGVIPKNSRDDNHNVTSEDTDSYKFVQAGDLVINKMKAWQGSLGLSSYEGIVSPAYYVCRFTSDKVSHRYFHHLIRSKKYAQEFERLSTGMRIGQWDLGIDDFLRVPILLPPLPEQSAIAAYLDEQCGAIDQVIAEAKATMEEYKAWKGSVIFEAVTKGFNPQAERKDSGVTWIGEIPKGWEVRRLKMAARRLSILAENLNGYIGLENVKSGSGTLVPSAEGENTPEGQAIKICPGNVIFGKLRPYLAKCYLVKKDGCCSSEFLVLKAKKLMPEFLSYLMLSPAFINEVNIATYGAKMPRANWEIVGGMRIPIPSVSEQSAIASYLDERCGAIDAVMEEKELLIGELEAYKRSLIFEVVTGKRRVW